MNNPHSRSIHGLTVLKNSHPDIRRLRKSTGNATIHGNKFWKSTSLLIDYLSVQPPPVACRILEIGCGWGLGGIYCAKHYSAQVTSLDADKSVFAYLQHHAQMNQVQLETVTARYERVTRAMLSEFDMVIASDICFWDEMATTVFNLIRRAKGAGVGRIVMTDPGRQPFRDMAERCCQHFDALYDNWVVPHPNNFSGLVLDVV